MATTIDGDDPGLRQTRPDGQQVNYLVLSKEDRAAGRVRPVRTSYRHVGVRPTGRTRELTAEERSRYARFGYALFEEYESGGAVEVAHGTVVGRYWTDAQLSGGCGVVTEMGLALAETYACRPDFYGGTFCAGCGKHLPVGEFVWESDGTRVGS